MARSSRSLERQVVAITGAGRGIGRATASACVRARMKVAIGDLDLAAAEQTAADLGHGTIALHVNVVERDSVRAFLDEVETRLGPLDVLVNNAGIMPLGPFDAESDATARRVVDINVHGVLHGMKEALPRMRARNRGHIVNIASTAARVGFAGGATYSGTKHFVAGVSEAVRAELRDTPIHITCVMPGVVNTELSAGTPQARFVPHIDPPLVADAIVAALRSPRFEVYVPRRIAPLTKLGAVVPTVVRDGFARLLALDRVLGGADAEARRAYEQRAARSGASSDEEERGAAPG
ncbi:MAG TPA: SDR family oxidoreductase [Solirubrobacteraceae bacterium]|nr:SDR family oxidoreductase [Solirubrobacteraceae bacterium]